MNKIKNYLVVFIALVLISGCCNKSDSDKEKTVDYPVALNNVKSATGYDSTSSGVYSYGSLVTVEHDGHLFIVEGRYQKGAILHHPDCPCLKSLELEEEK